MSQVADIPSRRARTMTRAFGRPTSRALAFVAQALRAAGANSACQPALGRAPVHFLSAQRIRVYPRIALAATVLAAVIHAALAPRGRWAVWGADFRAFYSAGA